jgi:hypothetical protein
MRGDVDNVKKFTEEHFPRHLAKIPRFQSRNHDLSEYEIVPRAKEGWRGKPNGGTAEPVRAMDRIRSEEITNDPKKFVRT